jgi:hypothetical protein
LRSIKAGPHGLAHASGHGDEPMNGQTIAPVMGLILGLAALGACGRVDTAPPVQPKTETQAQPAAEAATSFIVRFRAPHPLLRAQELEAAGRCQEAQQLARQTIAARPELAGLCFDRFTVGGAEIVLGACAPVADAAAFQQTWAQRFAAMEGVEYAEPNVIGTAAGGPEPRC